MESCVMAERSATDFSIWVTWATFSFKVMREMRSFTRHSTAAFGSLYMLLLLLQLGGGQGHVSSLLPIAPLSLSPHLGLGFSSEFGCCG